MHTMLSVPVLVVLTAVVVQSLQNRDNCGNLRHVNDEFLSCLQSDGLQQKLVELLKQKAVSDGVFTKDEALTGLEAICRNVDFWKAYENCTEMISTECPELRDIITSNVNSTLSIFCENDQPSSWLQNALQNGYTLTYSCIDASTPLKNIIQTCEVEAYEGIPPPGEDVDEALPLIQEVHDNWFHCAMDRTMDKENDELYTDDKQEECFWQDFFLTHWLYRSAKDNVGPVMGTREMEMLKNMMDEKISRT